jgi:hypothetical protein
MKRTLLIVFLGFVLILGGLAACDKGEENPPTNTIPIDQLIQAGKPPVEIGNLVRSMNPVAPTFTVTVANVSDCPVSLLKGVVFFYDENGAYIPDSKNEMGYSDISPIEPGGKIELQMITQNEKAVSGKWIIQEVVYRKTTGGYNLAYKWTNKNFDNEVAAAEVKT